MLAIWVLKVQSDGRENPFIGQVLLETSKLKWKIATSVTRIGINNKTCR